jgi:hypothetical protein
VGSGGGGVEDSGEFDADDVVDGLFELIEFAFGFCAFYLLLCQLLLYCFNLLPESLFGLLFGGDGELEL